MKRLFTFVLSMITILSISPLTLGCEDKTRISLRKLLKQQPHNLEQSKTQDKSEKLENQGQSIAKKILTINLNEISADMIISYEKSNPIYFGMYPVFFMSLPKIHFEDFSKELKNKIVERSVEFNSIRLLREKLTGVRVVKAPEKDSNSQLDDAQLESKLSDQQIRTYFIFNQFLLGNGILNVDCKRDMPITSDLKSFKRFNLTIRLEEWNNLKEIELKNKLDYFKNQEEHKFIEEYRFDRFIHKIEDIFVLKKIFAMLPSIKLTEIKTMYDLVIGKKSVIKLDIFSSTDKKQKMIDTEDRK